MILRVHDEGTEAELQAGRLSCECGGRLGPWGHARSRHIRQRDGSHVTLRPRRAICSRCDRTHVVLPLWSLPRRRDAIETVGDALFRAANGHGHRSIAQELALPPSTVRNWLRRARGRAEWLRQRAVQAGHEIDVCLPFSPPRASLLAEALDALGLTAWAAIRRFGWAGTSPWRVIAALSGGHLLSRGPDG
jgi:transposase-like protein